MPIDFLEGKVKKPIIKKEAAQEVEMHIPEKEQKIIAAKEVKKEAPNPPAKTVSVQENIEEVNLVNSFRSHLFKRRLTFIGLFVIIIVLLAGVSYYFVIRMPQPQPVNNNGQVNQNLAMPNVNVIVNENLNIENLNFNENINLEPVSPPAINEEPPSPPIVLPPVVLPDTELAPLRGALVKFAQESAIYLVESNGELRTLDQTKVVFKNGQNVNTISSTLIYVINNRWQDTRRGKDVKGAVDFDPRVLTPQELEPFE